MKLTVNYTNYQETNSQIFSDTICFHQHLNSICLNRQITNHCRVDKQQDTFSLIVNSNMEP